MTSYCLLISCGCELSSKLAKWFKLVPENFGTAANRFEKVKNPKSPGELATSKKSFKSIKVLLLVLTQNYDPEPSSKSTLAILYC